MTPRINIAVAILLLALGIPFYWYFINAGTDGAHAKPLKIADLRTLALKASGAAPVGIRTEMIGIRYVPLDFLAAGAGLWSSPTSIRAFQIVTSDGSSITIDSGITPQTASAFDIVRYDIAAQQRVNGVVNKARIRLYLSNFPLHKRDGRTDHAATPTNVAPHAVSAGIVEIPTPGLTDGSAMYFVRLQNGREFLLTGDAATLRESWQRIHPPARYVTSFRRPQDRLELSSWLMTINALHREAPDMEIVEGHDLHPMREIQYGFDDYSDLGLASGHPRDNPVMAAARGLSSTPNQGRKHAL
ncbi:hypothetical protein [Novosphingobium sp. 9]|uniref:hypothetical protein n=1 Tax=Novosphingobium sp. 9 TaxID=2025349 RepID=UPI0021B56643|nr:hypothetical protein [Novosphingobium sp. 9]